MKARDARLLETIQRVELFLHEQEERLQEIVTLPAKAQLANAKSWMVKAAAARERQGYEAAASVARKRELRDAVRTGMQRIVIATKLLPVQCPRLARIRVGREDMATGRLVLAAKVLVAEATPYQAGLIAQGLQEGFISELVEAAEALEAGDAADRAARNERRMVIESLGHGARVGRHALRLVGALMQTTLAPEDPLLAEWRAVVTGAAPRQPSPRREERSDPLAAPGSARHDWLGPARRCAAWVLRRRHRVLMSLIDSARSVLSRIAALFSPRGEQPAQTPHTSHGDPGDRS